MSNKKIIRCEICTKVIETANGDIYGLGCNNPFPLRYRVCCDSCNSNIVVPMREKISAIRAVTEDECKY